MDGLSKPLEHDAMDTVLDDIRALVYAESSGTPARKTQLTEQYTTDRARGTRLFE